MQAFSTEEELTKCFLDLKKYPNVIGIDGELQPKIKNGKILKKCMAIRVYVSRKIPRDQFKKRNAFFKIFNKNLSLEDLIPETINGFPVDVVEMGEVHSLDNEIVAPRPAMPRQKTQLRYRPLQAGTSATHYKSTACTLNCLFIENGTGRLLMASNNHCFGRENTAKVGDPILQPSPYDGGIAIDQIGEFYKCVEIKFIQVKNPIKDFFLKIFKTFKAEEAFFNRVDIAFASFTGCSNCSKCNPITNTCLAKVYGIGILIGKKLPNLNQRVQKVGRTTGVTLGTVISTSWTGTVKYSKGSATFIDCILISGKNFSLGGDSGSPVLDMNGNYIGALFAGSGNHSIICKYTNIEKEGNCELVILPPIAKIVKKKKRSK